LEHNDDTKNFTSIRCIYWETLCNKLLNKNGFEFEALLPQYEKYEYMYDKQEK